MAISALCCLGVVAAGAQAQQADQPGASVQLPTGGATLEGIPTVRIDAGPQSVTRRVLTEAEAKKDQLKISEVGGKFYWTSRENKLLQLNSSGPYTYLSSTPGQYIRLTRINDKISYVEHVDAELRSVTWWGELRIVVGKQ